MKRRTMLLAGGAVLVLSGAGAYLAIRRPFQFPPDTEPSGAYLRIAHSLTEGEPGGVFDYLEDAAQHAVWTTHIYRTKSFELVDAHFPEPERSRLMKEYEPIAKSDDGKAAFLVMAEERGYIRKLRRDLSGVASVQVEGERATIVTARDTRYSFRKREGGTWGLTMFTPELVTEANRAARDHDVVKRAAEDYAAAK